MIQQVMDLRMVIDIFQPVERRWPVDQGWVA
jgi:hypothetical protein